MEMESIVKEIFDDRDEGHSGDYPGSNQIQEQFNTIEDSTSRKLTISTQEEVSVSTTNVAIQELVMSNSSNSNKEKRALRPDAAAWIPPNPVHRDDSVTSLTGSIEFKTTTTTMTTRAFTPKSNGECNFNTDKDGAHEASGQYDSLVSGDIEGSTANISVKEKVKTVEITIGPQHFDLLKLLGSGAFGKVVLVQSRLDKKLFAMKVISKKLLRKKNNVSYMKSERDILTKVHHPFLVTLEFAFQTETKLFLVMNFLAGGELFLHLRRRGLILEKEVQFYLAEMILAIDFLHNKGVIHRDLKPENVLLREDGHICITDFGLAKELGHDVAARTLCGTSEYMVGTAISFELYSTIFTVLVKDSPPSPCIWYTVYIRHHTYTPLTIPYTIHIYTVCI